MFEQDSIMRVIKEMVRMLLKILFHIDTDAPAAELSVWPQELENLYTLLDLMDKEEIKEAENRIFELLSDNSMSSAEKKSEAPLYHYRDASYKLQLISFEKQTINTYQIHHPGK